MPAAASIWPLLASPRRQEILRLVWTQELPAGVIVEAMPDVTFGAVSQHLKALREAGLVEVRNEDRHRFYRARREALGDVGKALEQMWADALWRLKVHAEFAETRRGPQPRRRGRRPTKRTKETS